MNLFVSLFSLSFSQAQELAEAGDFDISLSKFNAGKKKSSKMQHGLFWCMLPSSIQPSRLFLPLNLFIFSFLLLSFLAIAEVSTKVNYLIICWQLNTLLSHQTTCTRAYTCARTRLTPPRPTPPTCRCRRTRSTHCAIWCDAECNHLSHHRHCPGAVPDDGRSPR